MKMNKTMLSGLVIAGLAWALLIWAIVAPDPLVKIIGQSGPSLGQHYLVTLAECGLFTGFVAILVGALQAGFGALDRFFEAILRRSSKQEQSPPPARKVVAEARPENRQVIASSEKPAARPKPAPRITDEGFLRGRTYALYSDGSVEVETLLWRKRFETMDAAIAYLGVDGNLLRKVA
jgi:hypothetical protein